MRTAYDALRKAIVKDFGWWYRKECPTLPDDVRERIEQGSAYIFFEYPFLTNLSDLCIGTYSGGRCYIRGKQSRIWGAEDSFEENIRRLKNPQFGQHFWVFSSFSFDDWFELVGFRAKADAIRYYKKQKKREDGIFYTFWYRW